MNYIIMKYVLDKLGFTFKPVVKKIRSSRSSRRDSHFPSFRASDVIKNVDKSSPYKGENMFDLNENDHEPNLVTLWRVLGGDYYGHITLNNLRMILMAIKGLHVQPDQKHEGDVINLNKLQTDDQNDTHLGIFNMNGDLYLSDSDVEKAKILLADLNKNRFNYESI